MNATAVTHLSPPSRMAATIRPILFPEHKRLVAYHYFGWSMAIHYFRQVFSWGHHCHLPLDKPGINQAGRPTVQQDTTEVGNGARGCSDEGPAVRKRASSAQGDDLGVFQRSYVYVRSAWVHFKKKNGGLYIWALAWSSMFLHSCGWLSVPCFQG